MIFILCSLWKGSGPPYHIHCRREWLGREDGVDAVTMIKISVMPGIEGKYSSQALWLCFLFLHLLKMLFKMLQSPLVAYSLSREQTIVLYAMRTDYKREIPDFLFGWLYVFLFVYSDHGKCLCIDKQNSCSTKCLIFQRTRVFIRYILHSLHRPDKLSHLVGQNR